ncbi:2-phosphosulfolactate phosphatase [Deinococcus apachensis]|uniref:2-phosphosulfolactate phosphatase n=1 Tax=Deinococcus apachensis TaxID=309886 RepID=UPI0003791353|nr:2-phosphosulfolactate phosphatase [Deinococcus apachensis]
MAEGSFWAQAGYQVQLEWGEAGVTHLAPLAAAVVVVDVLSFSTCVDVATARGAVVLPFRRRDARAAAFAGESGARLAGERRSGGPSLSPTSLLGLRAGERLVLPSPNGATLCTQAQEAGGAAVYAACLRNAAAVAEVLKERHERVLIVPAGERWPDGTLRPALEDLLGAGAVVEALGLSPSPEAVGARAVFRELRGRLPEVLAGCASGVELTQRGFPEDMALAAELNVSRAVPVLRGDAFMDVAG